SHPAEEVRADRLKTGVSVAVVTTVGEGGRAFEETQVDLGPTDVARQHARGARRAAGTDMSRIAHLGRTAWPPNWLRRGARTFAANESGRREWNRSNSDSAMTGAGTLSSIASSSVHRPSPESST